MMHTQLAFHDRWYSENSAVGALCDVYVIKACRLPVIKIGIVTHGDPKIRLRQLQCSSPSKLRLVGHRLGTKLIERVAHEACGASHSHNEWFHLDVRTATVVHTLLGKDVFNERFKPGELERYRETNVFGGLTKLEAILKDFERARFNREF